ncbi:hypothetical protein [Dyadobacter sandarakinus]|uniref:Lipoprotein n=1 Tax=Dyadobacter sandarakinus TaxID=2747268 RepID=A0ABX7I6Y8_9BACT|nr:hypothetical protein [Dyadobacter sandarakinus]QRR00741.1 hypothetical protein HWI92_07400 [Dyadobacter sandarakinus]
MKTLKLICCMLVAGCMLYACQQGEPALQPEPQVPAGGTPTDTGKPAGEPVQKRIGPAGGTISTPDHVITLVIPAGALSADTLISVQPVENKAWGGTGLGYELGPKNLELSKVATLIWHYTDADIAGSAPGALGIGYQQSDRSWKGQGKLLVDQAGKTVTAPVTKMLPVAFYKAYFMEPGQRSVWPGEQVPLTVFYQKGHADDGIPLEPLIEPVKLKKEDVKNWRVNGVDLTNHADPLLGTLSIPGDGAAAIYQAPARVPLLNHMTVSVAVVFRQVNAELTLFSNLKIEAHAGLKGTNPVRLGVQGLLFW